MADRVQGIPELTEEIPVDNTWTILKWVMFSTPTIQPKSRRATESNKMCFRTKAIMDFAGSGSIAAALPKSRTDVLGGMRYRQAIIYTMQRRLLQSRIVKKAL